MRRALTVAVIGVWGTALAFAEPPPAPAPVEDPAPRPPPGAVLQMSTYQGVAPGGPGLPPRAPRLPLKRGPQRLTWAGFQIRDGVPTVFIQLTAPVDWSVEEKPGELVYTFKSAAIHLRNNQRPLKVADFGTPVREVKVRPAGRDVKLIIGLAKPVSHRERTEEAAGGYKLLLVELSPR